MMRDELYTVYYVRLITVQIVQRRSCDSALPEEKTWEF